MNIATLTDAGRAYIANIIIQHPIHVAWGSGDAAWDDDPDKNHMKGNIRPETALVHELGRRVATVKAFVVPDDNGDIVIPTGIGGDNEVGKLRYSRVDYPTPNILVKASFDFGEAPNDVIREVAVFLDTVAKSDVLPGKAYLTPAEVDDPGVMLELERQDPVIPRSPALQQTFYFVLPI